MRFVCVTGMHRSGTSMVARMLNLLGIDLGDERELLGAAPDNPTGFWEHREVKAFNDRILAKLGGRWDDPPPLPPGWENDPELDVVRRDAARFIDDAFDARSIAWKDPRLSLTLPFWRTVTPIDRTVMCLRHPTEVIRSLSVRNGLAADRTADLWVTYTLAAWANDPDRIVIDYADALSDPVGTARALAAALGLPEPEDGTVDEIASFVDLGLRHHEEAEVEGPAASVAMSLHRLLAARSDLAPDPLLAQLHRTWHATQKMDELTEEVDRLIAERLETVEERARLQEAVERRDAELQKREREHQANLQRRDRAVRDRDLELEKLTARQARLEIDLEELQGSAAERDALMAKLREAERAVDKLEATNADLGELRSSYRELKREIRTIEKQRDELQRRYDRLRGRRIVRLSLTVASMFRPLFRLVRRIRSRGATPRGGRSEGASGDRGGHDGASGEEGETVVPPHGDTVSESTLEALRTTGRVTVVVPIYNALAEVSRCFESLVRNTTGDVEVLLIDDASTDPEMARFLDRASNQPNVRVLANEENRGFTATVNRGFDESSGDVVILNSDTEVTPRWIENLKLAAYSGDDVATATAVSNNAGAFSVPDIGQANPVPENLTRDQVGRLITRTSRRVLPDTPTGNGFCMYIKRSVIDELGGFDAEAFPRGYGEENDFCMRALRAGYRHVIDDATFVFHVREASFREERAALSHVGREVLDRRYPDYTERVRAFVRSSELRVVQDNVRAVFDRVSPVSTDVRPRLLYVIHAGMGGAPQSNEDLVAELDQMYECFVLTSDTRRLVLLRFEEGDFQEVRRLDLDEPIQLGQFSRADYRWFVSRVLVELGIEIVHVRHLIKHTFDAPLVAADLGIPVIVSFHDYYLSCPTVHLLDDQDRFCGGRCTPGFGRCRLPNDWLATAPEPLKHGWVHIWRDHVRQVLSAADALVTTTSSAREIYLTSFPELAGRRFEVIEHGRDLEQRNVPAPAPVPGGTIRILVPGNLDVHKGGDFIRALRSCDVENRLEFHLLGRVEDRFRDIGTEHGTYTREDFADIVASIAPSFVGLFSITAETYSHTLTEAWACGLPVLGSDLGALRERIARHGRGWVLDIEDPAAAYRRILDIADDPAEYWRVRRAVTAEDLPNVPEMAHEYDLLYRSVMQSRRPLATFDPAFRRDGVLDLRMFVVQGRDPGTYPGSVHVRSLRRYRHPSITDRVVATVSDIEAFLLDRSPAPDLVYLQRDAVPDVRVEDLLRRCRERGIAMVVDLDDNLVDEHQLPTGDDRWSRAAAGIRRLVSGADLVTVSTERLRDAMSRFNDHIEIVPNHLDRRLWFTTRPDPPSGGPIRVLYMGTTTHEQDLELIRQALIRVEQSLDVAVELEVVGGERQGPGQNWYTRVPVPSGTSHYPRFVRWLKGQAGRWHFAVAPLADTEFNSYKSDLKFLEYSALGLPSAASHVPAYASTVRHGETGLLVENTTDAWTSAIELLVRDTELRRQLRESSWRYVMNERALERHAEDLVDVLRHTTQRGSARRALA